jgi:bifunctional enzyme CysN/CysC
MSQVTLDSTRSLLRFLTCGSVDDGKSTLICRLLYDAQLIFEDQLRGITIESQRKLGDAAALDLSLLVDGLQAEREQGITIDVAGYRFFSTAKRRFIVADTPGHEQYTRNMADWCLDCRFGGVVGRRPQRVVGANHRHSCIASLLGIRHVSVRPSTKWTWSTLTSRFSAPLKPNIASLRASSTSPASQRFHYSALNGDNVLPP